MALYPHAVGTDDAGQVLFSLQNIAAMHTQVEMPIPIELDALTKCMQEAARVSTEEADIQASVEYLHKALDEAEGDATQPRRSMVSVSAEDVNRAEAKLKKVQQESQALHKSLVARREAVIPLLAAVSDKMQSAAVMAETPEYDKALEIEERIACALEGILEVLQRRSST